MLSAPEIREQVLAHQAVLADCLSAQQVPIDQLLRQYTTQIDALLVESWPYPSTAPAVLIALGGYGRQELYPFSDVDCLILMQSDLDTEPLMQWQHRLWDSGLTLSQKVLKPSQLIEACQSDMKFYTALLDYRLLAGKLGWLGDALSHALLIHDKRHFFEAKVAEMQARHQRYADNLEPDIKLGVGALRDIHTVSWLVKQMLGTHQIAFLMRKGIVHREAYLKFKAAGLYLAALRTRLHLMAQKTQDRLLFDYQRQLAPLLGFPDSQTGVEQMMRVFFRQCLAVSHISDLAIRLLREQYLLDDSVPKVSLDAAFDSKNDLLYFHDPGQIDAQPDLLVQIGCVLVRHPALEISAEALGLLRVKRHLIPEHALVASTYHEAFTAWFAYPSQVFRVLSVMHQCGVLSRLVPIFGDIVGQMQFDLFHTHTVDLHTLEIIRELQLLREGKHIEQAPMATKLAIESADMQWIFLAGFFHDLGKGRGCDHSEWGAVAIADFADQAGFSADVVALLQFLVAHHLLLSQVAQKQDITDPAVIEAFVSQVGILRHLDALMILTVADIRATNLKLLTAWQNTLLEQLYAVAKRQLQDVHQDAITAQFAQKRAQCIAHAASLSMPLNIQDWPDYYFQGVSFTQFTWHLQQFSGSLAPVVAVQYDQALGACVVFACAETKPKLFSGMTAALDALGLSVVAATLYRMPGDYVFHQYVVLNADGSSITHYAQHREIQTVIEAAMANPAEVAIRQKHHAERYDFDIPVRVSIAPAQERVAHMAIVFQAQDMPGLLAVMAQCLDEAGIDIVQAKIATYGARAEDIFYLQLPLEPAAVKALGAKFKEAYQSIYA